MHIKYSYLEEQFKNVDVYLQDIKTLVQSGDFTLGEPVSEFEGKFAELSGLPHAIGVSTGTDALALSLKSAGVKPGDEVITTPNTFVASVGAIIMVGAKPVFVDNNEEYVIDTNQIEDAITDKTSAIMPVHLTGYPADMPKVMAIASKHNLAVIEDAAQAILASIDGNHVGSWGECAAFSLHPLKNLNVWGDGGIVLTKSPEIDTKIRLLRNHGLSSRDEVEIFGHNCRLDSIQAVIANRLISEAHFITDTRIANATYLDQGLSDLEEYIRIPRRPQNIKQVFHTYVIQALHRDDLLKYLISNGVEAKIHYPIPLHLQKAADSLGYKEGSFPVCERHCKSIITLPVHQYLKPVELDYMINMIQKFYMAP